MNTAVTIRHQSSTTSHSRNSSPRRPASTTATIRPKTNTKKVTRNKGDQKQNTNPNTSETKNEIAEVKSKQPRNSSKAMLSYGAIKVMQKNQDLPPSKQPLQQTNHRDTSKRRNNIPSAKSRRTQRRKEIVAVTDALENAEADLLSSSLLTESPLQVTDSDDSITGDHSLPKQNSKKHSTKPSAVQSNTPSKSKPATRSSRTHGRSGSILEISQKQSSAKTPEPLSRTPPDDFMFGQPAVNPLYAGPTFSNSPAPSALPMPVTGVRPGGAARDDNLFTMEDLDTNANILRQKSRDLLDMLARPRSEPVQHHQYHHPEPVNMTSRYNVPYHQPQPIYQHQPLPFKMATSHKLQHDVSPSLSEIQQNLRTMLKIQSGM